MDAGAHTTDTVQQQPSVPSGNINKMIQAKQTQSDEQSMVAFKDSIQNEKSINSILTNRYEL